MQSNSTYNDDETNQIKAIQEYFPKQVTDGTEVKVLEMCLASIIWQTHPDCKTGYWFTSDDSVPLVPMDHPMRGNALLFNGPIVKRLQGLVRCGFKESFVNSVDSSQVPVLTGISPHVKIIRQNDLVLEKMSKIEHMFTEELPDMIKSAIGDQLNAYAEANGQVTAASVANLQTTLLSEIQRMFQANSTGAPMSTGSDGIAAVSHAIRGFQWTDNTIHPLPETYEFNKVKLKAALHAWFLPNCSSTVILPALRYVKRNDFALKKQKSAFSSSWKPLFNKIEKALNVEYPSLINDTLWKTQLNQAPTYEQVTQIWEAVVTMIPTATVLQQSKGKKRPRPQDFTVSYARKLKFERQIAPPSSTSSSTISQNVSNGQVGQVEL